MKKEGKVCNNFQGQYIFGDTYILQDSILSAKMKQAFPNLCLGNNVKDEWKGRNKVHHGLTTLRLLNEIL